MHTDLILGFVGVAAAVFGGQGFWAWLTNKNRKKSSEAKLLLGIAYSEIVRRAEHHVAQGYIKTQQYNELNRYLYEPYKAMGGNGTAEHLMELVEKLPSEPPKTMSCTGTTAQEGEKHEKTDK